MKNHPPSAVWRRDGPAGGRAGGKHAEGPGQESFKFPSPIPAADNRDFQVHNLNRLARHGVGFTRTQVMMMITKLRLARRTYMPRP